MCAEKKHKCDSPPAAVGTGSTMDLRHLPWDSLWLQMSVFLKIGKGKECYFDPIIKYDTIILTAVFHFVKLYIIKMIFNALFRF